MGWQAGDVVSIHGKKKTAALLWPGYPEDMGMGIVRLDGNTRRNAGASIDDKVPVKIAQAAAAESVTFAPTVPLRITGAEAYLQRYMEGRVITRGDIIEIPVMGRKIELLATRVSPSKDAAVIGDKTKSKMSEKPAQEEKAGPHISYEDIGGLGAEIGIVREMIELPLKHPELFQRLGMEPPKGVLLYGPPGTGKTLIAKALASETDANFMTLSGPEIMSKYYGESEKKFRNIFKAAEDDAPSIIFIDEIDSIAPKREEVTGEVKDAWSPSFWPLWTGWRPAGKLWSSLRPTGPTPWIRPCGAAVGSTVRLRSAFPIGTAVWRSCRSIPVACPSPDVNQEKLADVTHGFVGADLAALARRLACAPSGEFCLKSTWRWNQYPPRP